MVLVLLALKWNLKKMKAQDEKAKQTEGVLTVGLIASYGTLESLSPIHTAVNTDACLQKPETDHHSPTIITLCTAPRCMSSNDD